MRKIAALLMLLNWLVPSMAQQVNRPPDHRPGGRPAVPTVTRTVSQFTKLENALAEALHRKDEAAVSRLLTDDFELRTAASPGTPIPRSDWLTAEMKPARPLVQVSQMAVRILPESSNIAVVNFLSTVGSGTGESVVDLWVRRDGDWKLAARYSAVSTAKPSGKPTGKE